MRAGRRLRCGRLLGTHARTWDRPCALCGGGDAGAARGIGCLPTRRSLGEGVAITEASARMHDPWAGRRVAVVGLQRSNAAVARYLARGAALVEAYDAKPAAQLGGYAAALPDTARLWAGADYLQRLAERLEGLAAIFVTPGMRKDLPVLVSAAAAGIPLWTEAAYVLAHAPRPIIGITGSAGKTTTTTLVGEAVRRWRPRSLVGGNIGLPLIDRLEDLAPDAWLVMELSSFQLELCRTSPRLAALLNIRPNHLDVHGSYEAYVAAKRRVYRFQGPGDTCLFGLDDPAAAALAAEAPAGALGFRGTGPVTAGAGVVDGQVWWFPPAGGGGAPCPVLPLAAIRVPGQHNVENVAAAVALSAAAGVPLAGIAAAVADFRGVPHRLEPLRAWRGVEWINDSIATAPDRVAAALDSFAGRPITLLAGGYDKGIPLEALGRLIAERVRHVILFGATAERLRVAIAAGAAEVGRGPDAVQRVTDLGAAVAAAAETARPGEVVLLSPACASYDQFRDFEERGARFRDLVAALPE